MKVVIILFVFILMSLQTANAVVGYDSSEIQPDSPAYYNTVALVKKNNQSFRVFCTASIVADNIVFTAKHCIEAVTDLEVFVYFGDNVNELDKSLLRKVKNREKYNNVDLEISFPSFDFGYLELEGSIPNLVDPKTGDKRYKSIKILTDSEQVLKAEEHIVAGYGISETSPQLVHGIKRRVNTVAHQYVSNAQFTSLLLIEGNEGEGTCHGDSGGPLYAKYEGQWYLVGVASGFDVGLTPGSYKVVDPKDNEIAPDCYGGESVYTYVGDYTNWVKDTSGVSPKVSEVSQIQRPGLDIPVVKNPKSFSQWCAGTGYQSPAWETIRQLLYYATDTNKSRYSTNEILSNCNIAGEVLDSLKEVRFDEDSFFNDLSPVASLDSIESLSFFKTKTPDLSPFPNNQLKKLKLSDVGAESISAIKGLQKLDSLTDLDLTGNNIEDISPLKSFVNLKTIKLGGNKISDISLLENFKKLEVIEVYNNFVSDITPLLKLSHLKEFLAASNNISSPKEVANWPDLTMAILSYNNLTNLDFLKKSNKIKRLRTYGNPLGSN